MPAVREYQRGLSASRAFEDRFGVAPETVAFAPGRVNLLGEHTDYNGGYVLPVPLVLGVAVAIGRGGAPGTVHMASDQFDKDDIRRIDAPATGVWSDYVLGSLAAIAASEIAGAGVRLFVSGNLPVGAGLSSSAAVEVCTLRAAAGLFGKTIDPVALAMLARHVENDYAGVPCGIMDQFAISAGNTGEALFLDTRTLEHRPVPLPAGHGFLVVHSGVSHRLADDGYAARVAECTAACAALGVGMLSDLSEANLERIAALDDPLAGRARHIVTENRRVLEGVEALDRGDAARFGALMVASHISQRDDFEVSMPEVDALVDGALAAGATGARLTGGGFGGSVVVLVAEDRAAMLRETLAGAFPASGILAET